MRLLGVRLCAFQAGYPADASMLVLVRWSPPSWYVLHSTSYYFTTHSYIAISTLFGRRRRCGSGCCVLWRVVSRLCNLATSAIDIIPVVHTNSFLAALNMRSYFRGNNEVSSRELDSFALTPSSRSEHVVRTSGLHQRGTLLTSMRCRVLRSRVTGRCTQSSTVAFGATKTRSDSTRTAHAPTNIVPVTWFRRVTSSEGPRDWEIYRDMAMVIG
jgi:hypothetical protein